jgi:acyl transferase domain-containing protein
MERLAQRIDQLTPLQKAVLALKESQAKLEALQRAQSDPIAIVGMACRFPGGGNDPQSFWQMLCNKVDAIREVPPDRWDIEAYYDRNAKVPGKMNTRWGGFLDRIDEFDNKFFGISAEEAARIDPQQRLLMELAWEALEDAGLPAEKLAGSRTGVFLGVPTSDYGLMLASEFVTDAHVGVGTSLCIAANRLSFFFDFHGPSLSLDTACSSSLVAVHLACQCLRCGDARMALAGGVNVTLLPTSTVNLTKSGLAAPDGRCRSFDAKAAGYVRSEGGGIIVLKPLAAALSDGDPIYAVIRGSAVNQDGRSNGLKAPNRQAQEAVLREAYARARVSPGLVQFLETQGTATVLGDMLEAEAISNVLSADRPAGLACYLGAVKSNVGHLEGAAGIAGLIKAALVLKHKTIPPNLHCATPNPSINFERLPLALPTAVTPWPDQSHAAIAGVSAFGFGGTNAHVVLEEATPAARPATPAQERQAFMLPLSARSPDALQAFVRGFRDHLAGSTDSFADICYTAAARREHHNYRVGLVARGPADALDLLDAFLRGENRPGMVSGCKPYGRRPKTVFVFPGDPGEWRQAGRRLRDSEPAFRAALEEVQGEFQRQGCVASAALLDAGPSDPRWNDPAWATPTLFALQSALVTLWRSWGITPDLVAGLAEGETAAAWAAGILSLKEAARVALQRGKCTGKALETALATVEAGPATIPFISVAGSIRDGRDLSAEYWARAANQATDTATLLKPVLERRPEVFLEIGSSGVAGKMAPGIRASNSEGQAIASLTGCEDPLSALAALYAAGHAVDWDRLCPKGGHVRLPSYPWQRHRFWIQTHRFYGGPEAAARGDHHNGSGARDEGRGPRGASHVPPNSLVPRPPSLASISEDWFYEFHWEAQLRAESRSGVNGAARPSDGRWLILADKSGVGDRLAALLQASGQDCKLIYPCPCDALARALPEALRPDRSGLTGIVHLWNLDAPAPDCLTPETLDQSQALGCVSVSVLARELARLKGDSSPRLWLVTRGAHVLDESESPAVAQAPVWGLGRALAQEQPQRWGGLIDLDAQGSVDEMAAKLLAEISEPDGEDQIALRGGQRYVLRLNRTEAPATLNGYFRWRADATYLLTGGLGNLGVPIARWMIEQGARHLILLGRTPMPPRSNWAAVDAESKVGRKIAAVRQLEELGATIYLASMDVSSEAALSAYLESFRAAGGPLIRGVLHLAGLYDVKSVADYNVKLLQGVLRPKVAGTWVLQRVLRDAPLDVFVTFSSAATLGSPLLGGFGAANAFLESMGDYRRRLGQASLCISWGSWTEAAMTHDGKTMGGQRGRGLARITTAKGLDILNRVLQGGPAKLHVVPNTPEDWSKRQATAPQSSLLKNLVGNQLGAPGLQARPDLGIPYVAPKTELEKQLVEMWASLLRIDRVGINDNFLELGGDSLQWAIIANRIQEKLGDMLHIWALFETRNIQDLAIYLRREYPAAVKRWCPSEILDEREEWNPDWPESIGQAEMERAKSIVRAVVRRNKILPDPEPKNPRAILVLSAPRCGSTLFRVMLGGHPALFAPPELELLPFNTLADRKAAYPDGVAGLWLEGTDRALMEVRGIDVGEARALMRHYEDSGMTVKQFYRILQEAIGDRILVDKTPSYATNPDALQRIENLFEDALYIHLVRHPCAMIRSYVEYKMHQTFMRRVNLKAKSPFSPHQMGEIVWVASQQNILKVFETVPKHRQFQVRFEDLVSKPEPVMRDMCRFMGLPYHAEMTQPYKDKEKKMTTGTRSESRMQGDSKFLTKHSTIDASVAKSWAKDLTTDFLGEPARVLAAQLGYDIPPAAPRKKTRAGVWAEPAMARIPKAGGDEDADQLLSQVGQLSEQDVDSLLSRMLTEAEGSP